MKLSQGILAAILSLGLAVFISAHGKFRRIKSAEPATIAEVNSRLGEVDYLGTFRLATLVANLPEIGYPILARHHFVLSPQGVPRSEWEITGTRSSLVSRNPHEWFWNGLMGERMVVRRGSAQERSTPPFVSQIGNTLVVHTAKGTSWVYQDGVLRSAKFREGVEMRFRADAGTVHALTAIVGGRPISYQFHYDPYNRLRQIESPGRTTTLHWKDKQLLSVTRGDVPVVQFEYQQGLISTMKESGQSKQFLRWEYDRQRAGSVANQMQLKETATHKYSSTADPGTVKVKVTNKLTGSTLASEYISWRGIIILSGDGIPSFRVDLR